jgi:hypothetical protein
MGRFAQAAGAGLPEGGIENSAGTGCLFALFFPSVGSQSQGPALSTPSDPFTDSHAASASADEAANDVDQVDMSAFQNEDTGGSSWIHFATTSSDILTTYQSRPSS